MFDLQEFIPRGRQAVDEHPGPLLNVKKPVSVPSDFVLLQRMQDVNISLDETPSEYYVLREVYDDSAEFLFEANVNTEEELYVKGTTAVWTKGTTTNGDEAAAPHVCLTCETSIKFAFFCPVRFLSSECSENEKDNTRSFKGFAAKSAVCLVDGTTLKVHCDNGENFITSIECPVSNVWVTKHGILLEKESSSTLLDIHSVPLPRLFSLTHPLDEMCPVIIKMSGSVSYITETEYRVVFSCEQTDLVLMFDEKTGKHFICFLRKASEDEKNSVGCVNDSECFSNSAFTSSVNLSQPATPLPAAVTTPQSFYKTSRKSITQDVYSKRLLTFLSDCSFDPSQCIHCWATQPRGDVLQSLREQCWPDGSIVQSERCWHRQSEQHRTQPEPSSGNGDNATFEAAVDHGRNINVAVECAQDWPGGAFEANRSRVLFGARVD